MGPAQPAQRAGPAARSRSGSPAPPAVTTSRSGWRRSRPRSSGARRSCSTTTRWSATRSGSAPRRSLPAALPGRPVLRRRPLARARRDPRLPAVPDPRQGRLRDQGRARLPAARRLRPARRTPNRIDWQFGEPVGTAEVWIVEPDRVADRAPLRPLRRDPARAMSRRHGVRHPVRQRAPADRVGARARRATPGSWARRSSRPSCGSGLALLVERHTGEPQSRRLPSRRRAPAAANRPAAAPGRADADDADGSRPDAAIRPERFARLVTLASILIDAGRGRQAPGRRGAAARS